jgi:formylglycine-generating enzyme required for sulfatase activity
LAGAKSARGSDFALWALVEELCTRKLTSADRQTAPEAWGALLAGQALVENVDLDDLSDRNRAKVARVVSHLARILEAGRLPAVERAEAGVALAHLGDPRPGVGLREDGLPDIVWCEVPAGDFIMGSEDDKLSLFGKETPQRRVHTGKFAMSKYPVTNAQYAAFIKGGGYTRREFWSEAEREGVWRNGKVKARNDDEWRASLHNYGAPFTLPNHPIVGIMWYEGVAFCRWLSEQLGYEVRLPSEIEWEKAARGTDGRMYPWGEKIDPERANCTDTGIGTPSAVGCFPAGASPYGTLDMSGNVWEWTRTEFQESYEDYQPDLEVNRRAVVRGGAFLDSEGGVRCAYRLKYYPRYRYHLIGFRVVCGVPHTSEI